jgi:hypothetical protein
MAAGDVPAEAEAAAIAVDTAEAVIRTIRIDM